MVGMRGPETDAGAVIEPQPTPLGLFLRNLEPLLTPDAFHPLMVYLPPIPLQQGRDPSVSISPIPGGQGDDRGPEGLLIIPEPRNPPLGRSALPYRPARTPL
jgi:hypothetical protein